jgi:TonB family protein
MPRPVNGASAKIQRMPYAKPTGVAPKTGVVKRPAAVPPAAVMLRRRRSQRSLYLAAAASVLLLILLGWLLAGSSGPSPAPATDAAESTADAPARAAPAASDSAAAAPNSDSSVLDVVEELPRPGEESSPQDTRPAVVMRGTRAGEQLVRRVDPIYPAAARLNRIQGPVVLEASIGTHGFLRHIRVVSGDPLLAEAVLDAVKGWRYQPRTARGRAVETPTRIVVNFQLVARNSAPAR